MKQPVPDSINLQYYVVGFFDLLGQQEHLRSLRTLPDKSDPKALDETRQILRNTYGAVSAMRTMFSDAFGIIARKPFATDSLTSEQRKQYLMMNNPPLQYQSFSDSLIAFQSMTMTDSAKLPVRGVLGIFVAAALVSLGCLGVGHPIRGGIDIGLAFEPNAGEIYGSALARAVALESRVANYPRIVIGEELVRFLSQTAGRSPSDIFEHEATRIAKECIRCLATDDDGLMFWITSDRTSANMLAIRM
jgi:hypothetical protein